jgi:hypothetical protein
MKKPRRDNDEEDETNRTEECSKIRIPRDEDTEEDYIPNFTIDDSDEDDD